MYSIPALLSTAACQSGGEGGSPISRALSPGPSLSQESVNDTGIFVGHDALDDALMHVGPDMRADCTGVRNARELVRTHSGARGPRASCHARTGGRRRCAGGSCGRNQRAQRGRGNRGDELLNGREAHGGGACDVVRVRAVRGVLCLGVHGGCEAERLEAGVHVV